MYRKRLINLFTIGRKNGSITNVCRLGTLQANFMSSSSHTDSMASGSTIQKIREDLRTVMGVERAFSPAPRSRAHLQEYLPTAVSELPTRSMADSFMTAVIPLSTDIDLREKYTTFLGTVRIGRILEDMDIFAVIVAMRHIKNPKLPSGVNTPYTIVTAAVDRIDFTQFHTRKDADIRLSGHVTWVGRSSLEVIVWADQMFENHWQRVNKSLFLLAARDPTASRSAVVNALKPATPEEENIFNGGIKRREIRKNRQMQHVTKVIPNEAEQRILHELYIKSLPSDINIHKSTLPVGCVSMETASLTNLILSQPQDRNFHNRVFGGFLMRQAMELSWTCAYLYSKHRPNLKSITDISFNKPIAVNSLIRMHSYVAYTQMNYVQITLYAETWHAISGENFTTNALHFTYELPGTVPKVIPNTYHESMMYIDGRRRFLDVTETRNSFDIEPISDPQIVP